MQWENPECQISFPLISINLLGNYTLEKFELYSTMISFFFYSSTELSCKRDALYYYNSIPQNQISSLYLDVVKTSASLPVSSNRNTGFTTIR